ncbi:MFS transporter [Enterococcus columbae]|uniref:Major facilitator superfamily (MFS) profile domain-containing protein n=1 Tax=Enterococcus columbae DSM 7374 = ATCC 51263 TaxID=1121865 RepID=S0KU10_9ENTE|nr:MFS transporter [Enterococcus columbae]EOT43608.1 hypothetical protein OMW_00822 [Enterococcus columbae DSM 7374 = ATCC 51263]EOW87338.1 hypothetical protein I568_00382 [Enterococcus columbae DSM 7374 = ATCC 51263]OJG22272.1 hypothetical protein RR47_GL001047 [Enterococcus columbae DSM 7374 = ATCC 51263]
MRKQSFKWNIPILGGIEFFSFFGITSFWLLFLSQQGMTLWEIGILESIFHLTSLLSEVPSGILADRFTYKNNLLLGRIASIISAGLMIVSQGNFWLYALGMIFSAWGYNFDSGTSQALLFETAKEIGLENRYLKLTSLLNGILEATRTLGMVVAGFFVHGGLIYTYYIQLVLSLLSIVGIACLKEPTIKMANDNKQSSWQILQMVYRLFRQQTKLFRQMLVIQLLLTIISMYYFYYQNQLPNLKSWQISGIMLFSSIVNLLSITLSNLIGKRYQSSLILWVMLFLSGGLFLMTALQQDWLYALIFLITDGLVVLFYPIYETELQNQFVSEVRATMLSVYTMLGSLAMIFLFPLMGWLIDYFGFNQSFVGLGSLLLAMAIWMRCSKNKRNGANPKIVK